LNHPVADFAHDLFAAGEHRDRITVGGSRTKGAEVCAHTERFLGPSTRDAKPGRILIDNQDDSEAVAERADIAEVRSVCSRRRTVYRNRLDQKGTDLIAVAA